MRKPHAPGDGSVIAVVGGAGFVGCNLANAYAAEGRHVRVIDSLARPGSEKNLAWLKSRHPGRIDAAIVDIRDETALAPALEGAGAIYHLAAQVAVTTSMGDPRADFDINARGTLNLLEWLRTCSPRTPLVFASTNKVYGCLEDVVTTMRGGRHEPVDETLAARGVSERQPLALRTPYGCSKGAADQYVLDYARSFGLRTAVLRMSCIYGPRQFGNEDQGWVAHFLLRALEGSPITIYGDGAQVRDILHVSDAVNAYRLVCENIDDVKGEAFNLGGGPANAISLRQLIRRLRDMTGEAPVLRHGPWRSGDQPWFVADTSKIQNRLAWRITRSWIDGLGDLENWLRTGVLGEDIDTRRKSA